MVHRGVGKYSCGAEKGSVLPLFESAEKCSVLPVLKAQTSLQLQADLQPFLSNRFAAAGTSYPGESDTFITADLGGDRKPHSLFGTAQLAQETQRPLPSTQGLAYHCL